MNRRTFFQRTAGALAAAALAPLAAKLWPATSVVLTYKGIPLVFDPFASSNTIYFLSKDGPWRLNANLPPEKLWSDLHNG